MIQAANFILPLVVIPYLIDKLEMEYFGLVSFAQALMQLFITFTDYGFNLSATKEVSISRSNQIRLSDIFNNVLQSKLVLFVISALTILLCTIIIPSFREHRLLYLFGITMVLGQTLIPVWFFQGIEKMRYLTLIHLISKIVFTSLIFIFIQTPGDYIYVNLLYGVGGIIAGILSILLAVKNFSVKLKLSSVAAIKHQVTESFPFFLSNLSNNVYIYANIIILKILSTNEIVGYFSVAEKVFAAAKRLIEVLFLTVYPHACKLSTESAEALQRFFSKFLYLLIILLSSFGLATFFFAEELVVLIAGDHYPISVLLLKILSFAPLIIGINIPAYQTALIFNFREAYVGTLVVASILNIIFNFYFVLQYGVVGTVLSILFTEIFVTTALHFVIWRKTRYLFFAFSNIRTSKV